MSHVPVRPFGCLHPTHHPSRQLPEPARGQSAQGRARAAPRSRLAGGRFGRGDAFGLHFLLHGVFSRFRHDFVTDEKNALMAKIL